MNGRIEDAVQWQDRSFNRWKEHDTFPMAWRHTATSDKKEIKLYKIKQQSWAYGTAMQRWYTPIQLQLVVGHNLSSLKLITLTWYMRGYAWYQNALKSLSVYVVVLLGLWAWPWFLTGFAPFPDHDTRWFWICFHRPSCPQNSWTQLKNKESRIVRVHFVRAIWCAVQNRTKPDLSRSATNDKWWSQK